MDNGRGEISVLVDGRVPHFSNRLVKLLKTGGVDVQQLPYLSFRTSFLWIWKILISRKRIVHLLQGHYPSLVYLIPMMFGKKLIVHWIGTDVQKEVARKRTIHGCIRRWIFKRASLHLTDFEGLRLELEQLPIHAPVVPLVPAESFGYPDSWTGKDGVLTYIPEGRSKFYGLPLVIALASRHPDIRFFITAHSGKQVSAPENVTFCGWVDDIDALWEECRVLVRMTEHDGLSHSVIEALARGKYVIWTQAYPYCLQAVELEEAENALIQVLAQDGPNRKGQEHVRRELDPKANLAAMVEAYKSVLVR